MIVRLPWALSLYSWQKCIYKSWKKRLACVFRDKLGALSQRRSNSGFLWTGSQEHCCTTHLFICPKPIADPAFTEAFCSISVSPNILLWGEQILKYQQKLSLAFCLDLFRKSYRCTKHHSGFIRYAFYAKRSE